LSRTTTISAQPYDGSDPTIVSLDSLGQVDEMVVGGGDLFWSTGDVQIADHCQTYGTNALSRAPLTGARPNVVLQAPSYIRVATSGDFVFWSATPQVLEGGSGDAQIVQLDRNDGSQTVLATPKESGDIAADATSVFWIEGTGDVVEWRMADGSRRTLGHVDGADPKTLAVDATDVYIGTFTVPSGGTLARLHR
jgi:hypothetical protein